MTNDESKADPPRDAAAPPPHPRPAWQPVTPRGVAAFARATLGRLLLIELIVALLAAGSVVWFLSAAWLPTVRQAIHQLPEQGILRHGRLDSSTTVAQTLAENRPFLIFVLDLEKQRNASQTSDVLVEFHQNNFQVCSIFGCLLFEYSTGWNVEFNRAKLGPLWEAWEPILLGLVALSVLLVLFLSWALLATFYCGLVRLFGFFKDRDLSWFSSWRLASAALLPGALVMTAGVFCYGSGVIDLIRLLLLFLLHFSLAWVYLAISPLFVPRLPSVLPRATNPFAAPVAEKKEADR